MSTLHLLYTCCTFVYVSTRCHVSVSITQYYTQVLDVIHYLDVVEVLRESKCTHVDAWVWKKQLRFYAVNSGGGDEGGIQVCMIVEYMCPSTCVEARIWVQALCIQAHACKYMYTHSCNSSFSLCTPILNTGVYSYGRGTVYVWVGICWQHTQACVYTTHRQMLPHTHTCM